MTTLRAFLLGIALLACRADEFSVSLPQEVHPVWDMARAYREATPASERICINGLWRWQPANADAPPANHWGFFKVPGPWPGITDYMQKDSQTLFAHEAWKNVSLPGVTAAWYQREITVPATWIGRRIVLSTEYLNSHALVYIDGKRAGEMRFPTGEVDLTDLCRPGERQVISLLVTALPLKGVLLSYTDSASARQVKGSVARRGVCGDLFLEGVRKSPRIARVTMGTSVRKGTISFLATLENLDTDASYQLAAEIIENGHPITTLRSDVFQAQSLHDLAFGFTNQWKPERLWDIYTPTNQFDVALTLLNSKGEALDRTVAQRFGFRELWINGRDFFLNGTRIFLSAVPLDNAQVGAAWSTYAAARESLERLKNIGINFVYTHNYGCEPGSHLSFEEILRAADDVGMLVALSQPHFSHYEWKSADADRTNGYATHAQFYARVAGNHPSVVFYSMSHNATGYNEDMNPDMIDGIQAPRDQWASNNVKLALRAEAIVNGIDPNRIVYHHASGNLGSMHPMNFYPNFVPIQELSDWFGHWSTNGVKPAFLCEYGAPFTWDWTMYRGWYKGQREFGSAKVPWEFCVAEWNAQFLGDRAYDISNSEKVNLRWEAKRFAAGDLWHRWDYPFPVGSDRFDEQYPIFARYLTDNWRAFRGWNVSAISPWEYEHFWKLRPGVRREREQLPVDRENLQRPGYSPDFIGQRYERMDLAFERNDWIATPAAEALTRNNGALLAFFGGKPDAFTSKDHNFLPNDLVEKQVIVINNSREIVQCDVSWGTDFAEQIKGETTVQLPTGEQGRTPVRFKLPAEVRPGRHEMRARIRFSTGDVQEDIFAFNVVNPAPSISHVPRLGLFDPKGETETILKSFKVQFRSIDSNGALAHDEILIVGKGALEGNAPDISKVRDGLRVIIFEQSSKVLEKRFGFRVEEYGLREVFPRVPDHPVLAGIAVDNLRDWRGEATLLPERLDYEMRPRYGPTVKWCDIPVTRIWRCGNRGNVASVLIEKPARGDFLPIVDGGYALQYSPLLEYREGQGMVLFCQLDVTGRTETDPVAETFVANILNYVAQWKAEPKGKVIYSGAAEGRSFLEAIGLRLDFDSVITTNDLVVLGPQFSSESKMKDHVMHGGRLLAVGLSSAELKAVLPFEVETTRREHISSFFEAPKFSSALRGIAPADLHNRAPGEFELIASGADISGDGVIAQKAKVVLMQIAPWEFKGDQNNLRRTYRRFAFALSRLLANSGAEGSTPLLDRFKNPPRADEKRWLEGFYVDTPQEWDDPYRFFRW